MFPMAMDVEAEIRDLKRRVSEIEGSFGFLTQQIKGVHKDLLSFQARTEQRFEKVDGRFDKVDGRLDQVEKGVQSLRADMPGIVGSAMREVLREQRGKSRKTP
jgi:tetrahydromethanopterin S-methyltransferase subunit G